MRITRNQSIVFATAALIGFFVLASWLGRSPRNVDLADLARPATTSTAATPTPLAAPGVSTAAVADPSNFMMKDFHRSETRDGKLIWEVVAARGQYFPESSSAKVNDAVVTMYRKNGQTIELRAAEATLYLEGVGLTRTEASGKVTVVYDRTTTLVTESATYDHTTNLVRAPGLVTITGELVDISGEELLGNIETKEFNLKRNVTTTIRPASAKS